ncbi:TonB-dependent receptor [Flavobacterium sp.]|uniref:TonB-dependent receptor n=1 Tax=Flavobacterium sp. TaxID=239 RepID=UPI0026384A89|nr:TonB-dependent receptor [Flavobacterium sp.]
MKTLFTILLVLTAALTSAQTVISGSVTDEKGNPVNAANIYLQGTYDGALTAEDGTFSFETTVTGEQILVISFLSYEEIQQPITVEQYKPQAYKLRENVNTLNAVVISAGTFQAGDNTKTTVLKPLDIVTTAGSAGDIIAALQTLPGTQAVGESGRLFVRGGEADETQTFVDGIRVAQPYGAAAANIPTRGRFSPFLFKGMTFSTGGYSAEYGEALSSVLLVNTIDEPVQEQTDISLMTVGLGLGNTQKWEKSSLTFNTAYINLEPYQWLVPQDVSWNKPYQSLSGETVYRYQLKNGLFKAYAAFDHADFSINQESINATVPVRTGIDNNNLYVNTSYNGVLPNMWTIHTGLSYGYSSNKIGIDVNDINNDEHSSHIKLKFKKTVTNRFKLSFGADYFLTDFDEKYIEPSGFSFKSGYINNIAAAYAETDIFFTKKFALKAGLRSSYSQIPDEVSVEPRAALAYKTGKNGQFSLAYGDFYQTPRQDYLKYAQNLNYEKTKHYILNYMYSPDGYTLRAEAYYKDYGNLVKFDTNAPQYNSVFSNSGDGYAKGIDLFWRDNKSVKNLEYWVSYSYIDSERDYRDYEYSVTPSYIAKHNFSVVTKYWINSLRSQLGVTYMYNSGRPYDNPNEEAFMNGKTTAYHNLSLSWAWLLSQQKIVYFSVSNLTGNQNIFGYEYANNPGTDGTFARQAITQPADRFFFVGFFWTISDNKQTNQLDNL